MTHIAQQDDKGSHMEKIASFKVDHLKLDKGLYVSRVDRKDGVALTTFDLRMRKPNFEPVMDMPALHTIEHLGATFLRNARKDEVVYFGPMGCRTGFYLVMFGDLKSKDVLGLVTEMCDFIIGFRGDIPGAKPEECGNYLEQNLDMAKFYIAEYRSALQTAPHLEYEA